MAKPSDKSASAFRTISEAAEIVGVAQHVLRFWETRFPQLQPLKRGGNRRYYRPADMALLETIRGMLHDQGLTIRGAQLALASGKAPEPVAERPQIAPKPEVVAAGTQEYVAAATVDIVRLQAIRDRLRLALAA